MTAGAFLGPPAFGLPRRPPPEAAQGSTEAARPVLQQVAGGPGGWQARPACQGAAHSPQALTEAGIRAPQPDPATIFEVSCQI